MLSLFQNRSDLPIRMQLDMKYRNARVSLLLVVAFTFINMVMRVSQVSSYWLFSANIPFFLTDLGMYFGGMYANPTEGMIESGFGSLGVDFFYGMLAVSILIVGGYFLAWLMSANGHIGWMIGALVAFALDTVFVLVTPIFDLYGINVDFVFDLLLHAYVLYALVDGILARRRYLALPPDAPIYDTQDSEA